MTIGHLKYIRMELVIITGFSSLSQADVTRGIGDTRIFVLFYPGITKITISVLFFFFAENRL
jgi:hypothetical protein